MNDPILLHRLQVIERRVAALEFERSQREAVRRLRAGVKPIEKEPWWVRVFSFRF